MDVLLPRAGEEPHDAAMRVLLDVDKGLRSSVPADQLEALARLTPLLDVYPMPVVVNTALLKLGDVFTNATNLIRVYIVRTLQHCESHTRRVLNKAEIVRRFGGLLHSNDAEARTLALRALATMSDLLTDAYETHQGILSALDALSIAEVEAALLAASAVCERSSSFAESISAPLFALLDDLTRSVELKAQAVLLLQHMSHSAAMADRARAAGLAFSAHFTSIRCTLATIDALSHLSARHVPHRSKQIRLLLDTLASDTRRPVQLRCMSNLVLLFGSSSEAPAPADLTAILSCASHPSDLLLQARALVLLSRIKTLADTNGSFLDNEDTIMMLAAVAGQTRGPGVVILACKLLELIARTSKEESHRRDIEMALLITFESAFGGTWGDLSAQQVIARVLLRFVAQHPAALSNVASQAAILLGNATVKSKKILLQMAHSLVRLAPNTFAILAPAILPIITSPAPELSSLKALAIAVGLPCADHGSLTQALASMPADGLSLPAMYDVTRDAMIDGAHSVASVFLERLVTATAADERFSWWLSALKQIADAEATAAMGTIDALSSASELLATASALLMSAQPRRFFQTSYVLLRMEMMDAIREQLVILAHPLHGTLAINQFEAVGRQWSSIAERIAALRASQLSLKRSTRTHLDALETFCHVISSASRLVASPTSPLPSSLLLLLRGTPPTQRTAPLARAAWSAATLLVQNHVTGISYSDVRALLDALVRMRVGLPTWFFLACAPVHFDFSVRVPGKSEDAATTVKFEGILRGRARLRSARVRMRLTRAGEVPELNSADVLRRMEMRAWLGGGEGQDRVVPVVDGYFELVTVVDATRGATCLVATVSAVDENGREAHCGPDILLNF